MKKKFALFCISIFILLPVLPCFAVNIGTYKTETEYGLLDGFKINWKRKDKNQKFIEPREESTKKELEKEYKNYSESEYERTRYMYDGRAIL
ncbi:MAG: hypothetical protein LUG16_06580 [Candidatus Gastranaerophilales bacterium]|nr:hypothetical protein [Candidatus Gastranaerophilales bacterium]